MTNKNKPKVPFKVPKNHGIVVAYSMPTKTFARIVKYMTREQIILREAITRLTDKGLEEEK